MKYNALIFDMDGTLVHNMPTHNQAWQDTLAEAGVQINQEDFNRTTTGKKTHEILRLMLGSQLSDSELDYWAERKDSLYRERYACCREPLAGLLHLLEQATTLGLPMAVAIASPPQTSLLSWMSSTYAASLRPWSVAPMCSTANRTPKFSLSRPRRWGFHPQAV